MEALCQAYLDNLAAACVLVKPQVTSDMSEDQMIETIRGCAETRPNLVYEQVDSQLRVPDVEVEKRNSLGVELPMIETIRGCAGQLHQLHQENDKILDKILFSKSNR